jgi:hypothetical protein
MKQWKTDNFCQEKVGAIKVYKTFSEYDESGVKFDLTQAQKYENVTFRQKYQKNNVTLSQMVEIV